MNPRHFAIAFALLISCRVGESPSVAQTIGSPPASAQASASPEPVPCASPPPDLFAAFAYDIKNPKMLRFISRLANLPAGDQKKIFDAAVSAAASPIDADLSAAVAAGCADPEEVNGGTRAFALIWFRWTLDDLDNQKKFDAFGHVVSLELAAIALGDRLSYANSAAAATPFALLNRKASPEPTATATPGPGSPCADARASVIKASEPDFPAAAALSAVTGSVLVKVTLNATGDVESTSVYRDGLSGGAGAQQLVLHTIYAADLTTYAPEIRNCTAIPGKYLFTAVYQTR